MSKERTAREIAQQMLDEIHGSAAAIVREGQTHVPMLFIQQVSGLRVVLPVGNIAENKDHMAMIHREAAQIPDVEAVALIMECWVAKTDNEDDPVLKAALDGSIAVRDIPLRTEGVMFSIRVGAEQFFALCHIDRAAKTLSKEPLVAPDSETVDGTKGSIVGRFVGDGHGLKRRGMN